MNTVQNINENGILKDNIFYFNTPVKAFLFDFMKEHPDSNVLIKRRDDQNSLDVEIVAYAVNPDLNYKLTEKFIDNNNYEVHSGMSFAGNEITSTWKK